MVSETSSLGKRQFHDGLLIGCLVLALLFIAALRQPVFFRDYAITFEGAYRLYLGQVPFRDFGAPVGPGAFVLPALAFLVVQPDWTTFMWVQQVQNIGLLLLLYTLLRRLACTVAVTRIALACFLLCYLVLLTHPWYNSTGVLLMLSVVVLSLYTRKWKITLAGVLAGCALLTKQDFGLLSVLLGLLFIAKTTLDASVERIAPDWRQLLQTAYWRTLGLRWGLFLVPPLLIVAGFIAGTDSAQFLYWFNYGQPPHDVRGIKLSDLLGNSFGIFGLLTAAIALYKNNFRLLVASAIVTAASVSRTTSGLGFTHYYYVPFLLVALHEIWHLQIRWRYLLLIVLAYGAMRMLNKPVRDSFHVFENLARGQAEHYFFDHRALSSPLVPFPATLHRFSPGTVAPQATMDGLLQLKQHVADTNHRLGRPPTLLNFSELTPLYAELGLEPPRGLPLWFHVPVSLFPREIETLKQTLARSDYDLVVLQGAHEGMTPTYQEFYRVLVNNTAYRLLLTIEQSPGTATSRCTQNCATIFVFAR